MTGWTAFAERLLDAIDGILTFATFWLMGLALVTVGGVEAPPDLGALIMLDIGGRPFPVITGAIALLGVACGRPLAPKKDPPLTWRQQLAVTVAAAVAAIVWVDDSHPGLLFAFIVALGLGFAMHSVIELAGEELKGFVKTIITRVTGMIGGGRTEK